MQTDYIDLKNLKLDFNNPRFSNFNFKTENEIIDYLVKYENIKELIVSILKNGYVSLGEPLIVLKNSVTDYTVLEGNRRIAALKKIMSDNKESIVPNTIRCDIVNDREDAFFKISSKHISGMKKWSPIEKKQFYENQFKAYKSRGLNTDDAIREIYNYSNDSEYIIKKDISTLYFAKNIHKITKNKHPDLGPLSHIESDILTGRIYNRLTELISLETDNDTLKVSVSEEYLNLYNSILYQVGKSLWVDRILNSRLINSNKDFDRALNSELSDLGRAIEAYNKALRENEEPITEPHNILSSDSSPQPNISDKLPQGNEEFNNKIDSENNNKISAAEKNKGDRTSRIRLAAINELITINKLPFILDNNIILSINDNIHSTRDIINYTSQSKGNLFIDKNKIVPTTKNGTYTIDAEFRNIRTSFTVIINLPTDVEIDSLFDSDWFYTQCENLSSKQNTEKTIKTLSILHKVNLQDELDRLIASPLLRSLIEYSLSIYIKMDKVNVSLKDNLPGGFNNITQIINDKYKVFDSNEVKQMKSVKNSLTNLNTYIHDEKGIASSVLLSDLFNSAKPILEFIFKFDGGHSE